jgi:hypothetical protein
MGILALVVLVILLLAFIPRGPEPVGYYAYAPSGLFFVLLVVVLVLLLSGVGPVRWWW